MLQERRLDAEEKKFAAGMSTNFLVTQSQRDLAVAEVAELRAIADYRKSLVNFERVQEAGGGGVLFTGSSLVGGERRARLAPAHRSDRRRRRSPVQSGRTCRTRAQAPGLRASFVRLTSFDRDFNSRKPPTV